MSPVGAARAATHHRSFITQSLCAASLCVFHRKPCLSCVPRQSHLPTRTYAQSLEHENSIGTPYEPMSFVPAACACAVAAHTAQQTLSASFRVVPRRRRRCSSSAARRRGAHPVGIARLSGRRGRASICDESWWKDQDARKALQKRLRRCIHRIHIKFEGTESVVNYKNSAGETILTESRDFWDDTQWSTATFDDQQGYVVPAAGAAELSPSWRRASTKRASR